MLEKERAENISIIYISEMKGNLRWVPTEGRNGNFVRKRNTDNIKEVKLLKEIY